MRTIKTPDFQVMTFDELTPESKEKAVEQFRQINVEDYEWWDSIYEMFKEDTTEFDVEKIYFSGFWSQGDGAMFEYSGISEELVHEAIDSLDISKYKREAMKSEVVFSAKGTHRGHYCHERSCHHIMYFEVNDIDRENIDQLFYEHHVELEDFIEERYRDLAHKLYRSLEEDYEYLTNEEAIIETIIANEYEFHIDGSQF